jgi:hypothetical protein
MLLAGGARLVRVRGSGRGRVRVTPTPAPTPTPNQLASDVARDGPWDHWVLRPQLRMMPLPKGPVEQGNG